MKGIILAGGAGSRLYPMTQVISKQLQPIYDKPMIYYPLSMLMLVGIKDILIISTHKDLPHIITLLGSGADLGLNLEYRVQDAPNGIAEAFIIGADFIRDENVTLILGDNLFYGHLDFFKKAIKEQLSSESKYKAQIFGIHVEDPTPFGVVEFDKETFEVLSIEEKPKEPKSNYAIPGLYIFDKTVTEKVKTITRSQRGELEITCLIKKYLTEKSLRTNIIGRGVTWLDTGTPQSLLEASMLIANIEKRQGFKVGCIQEVAVNQGFITKDQFKDVIEKTPNSSYKDYLNMVLKEL
jgi:glucose-1-phosphate thymidylyltransferase